MVGNSPSNGPFRHAFHYTLPSDNDTQHAINTRVLNEYSINNVNIRKYFTLRVCIAYCIVGHSPLYIYYELLMIFDGYQFEGRMKVVNLFNSILQLSSCLIPFDNFDIKLRSRVKNQTFLL